MKDDIIMPKVENVACAVAKDLNDQGEENWYVFLVNLKEDALKNVIVSSRGYGQTVDGEKIKTSTLRHFFDEIKSQDFIRIEPIMEDLFGLNNEYWVSFYIDGVMHDKKYIFLPESIKSENFKQVPVLDKEGVLIV